MKINPYAKLAKNGLYGIVLFAAKMNDSPIHWGTCVCAFVCAMCMRFSGINFPIWRVLRMRCLLFVPNVLYFIGLNCKINVQQLKYVHTDRIRSRCFHHVSSVFLLILAGYMTIFSSSRLCWHTKIGEKNDHIHTKDELFRNFVYDFFKEENIENKNKIWITANDSRSY